MMFFKSIVSFMIASKVSGLGLEFQDNFFQSPDQGNGSVNQDDGDDMIDADTSLPTTISSSSPSTISYTMWPEDPQTRPPVPEDPKGEFILKIAKDAKLELIIKDFKAKYPDATIKGTFTSDPIGFAVDGVTDTEIKMFANSCSNLVLDIFKLFQAAASTPVSPTAEEESNGCIAKPPSGTITMEVVYDTFAYETHFSLWQLNGVNWESIGEYAPPFTYPLDRQVVTKTLADGEYSMDVVDMAHNGMSSPESVMWGGYNGHFKLIETDSGKELYKGAEFGTFVSVEFTITNGEVKVNNVKSSGSFGYFG